MYSSFMQEKPQQQSSFNSNPIVTVSSPEKFGVEKKVLFLDYVTDQDLPEFYKKAEK